MTDAVAPLILTLELDPEAQAWFEGERRRWFPRSLNRVPAHVSLFHALPGEQLPAIAELLGEETAGLAPFPLEVNDLMKLGKGVAYALASEQLQALHTRLRSRWADWLTPQDRQGFRPHIVVQNKSTPEQARELYSRLSASFRPWAVEAAALRLWHYRGGPWEPAASFPFGGDRT
jgi:2'-5' RNA ligase